MEFFLLLNDNSEKYLQFHKDFYCTPDQLGKVYDAFLKENKYYMQILNWNQIWKKLSSHVHLLQKYAIRIDNEIGRQYKDEKGNVKVINPPLLLGLRVTPNSLIVGGKNNIFNLQQNGKFYKT